MDLPNSARAHSKYGFTLHKADRFDEAVEQYRTALRLDPNGKDAHFGLGQALVAQSRLSEGRNELEEALRSDPRNGEYHSEYGYTLELLGQKGEARTEYTLATRLATSTTLKVTRIVDGGPPGRAAASWASPSSRSSR